MSVMQIVTQTAAGPARLGAAASTISLARTLGSSLGASAFGALIYGLIGGAPVIAGFALPPPTPHRARLRDRLPRRGGALRCSRPGRRAGCRRLRFDAEQPVTAPAVD